MTPKEKLASLSIADLEVVLTHSVQCCRSTRDQSKFDYWDNVREKSMEELYSRITDIFGPIQ